MRMRRIEGYMLRPEEAQERWLHTLLDAGKDTEYGKKHGFSSIRNAESFAKTVPMQDYEGIKGQIARMMQGEQNVLWPGEVNWYSKSSGTTSEKSKFIPIPEANLYACHIAGSWDSLALLYHNKPDMEVFRRRNLVLPGSYESLKEYPKTKFGDISALLTFHMPAIGRMFYTPDFDIALQPNFEDKINQIATVISKQDDIVMVAESHEVQNNSVQATFTYLVQEDV